MRAIYVALCLMLFGSIASAEPVGLPAFRVGDPIYFTFSYEGGIDGWDGEVSGTSMRGRPCLVTSNSVFMVLTKGRQPFVTEQHERGTTIPLWKTMEAKHGVLVEPKRDAYHPVSYNVALTKPFRSTLELTKYYKINSPGLYTVYWGIEGLWTEEVVFEVLSFKEELGIERR